MTSAYKCDGCGKVVQMPTVEYRLNDMMRMVGGDFTNTEGQKFEWNQQHLDGDLCGDCGQEVINTLREIVDNDR